MMESIVAEASASLTQSIGFLPDPKTFVTDTIQPLTNEFFTKYVPVIAGITLVFYLIKRFGRG